MLRQIFSELAFRRLTVFGALVTALLMACAAPTADTFEEAEELGTVSSALVTLMSLTVAPDSPSMPAGLTQLFKASGLYSDGKTRTLTSGITWASGAPGVASIAADGTALTLAPGTTTVSALHTASGKTASTTFTVTAEALVSVDVTPLSKSVGVGATVNYVATAKFSAGTTAALKGSIVAWTSSNAALAPIDAAGKVVTTAAGTGTATITARHVPTGRQSPPAELFVSASPLTSITLTPASPVTLPKGTTRAFIATGVLANGMTSDLTGVATWSSTKVAAATVPAGPGSSAIVTAVDVGSATIRAKFGTITGSATVTVPAAVLTHLAITPPSPRITLGTTPQLTATGTYDDLTTLDRTETVTWSSSATSILKVSTAAGSRGKLTPVKVGTATITAKDAKTGVTATAAVTVTNVSLTSIAIAPSTITAPVGIVTPFHATGTWSDFTTTDVTTSVTWSATAGATISNAAGSQGVATATAAGSVTIKAQVPTTAITATATLTVTPAALARIDVTPATSSLVRGLNEQMRATGVYTDGATVDLTTTVGWTSSNATWLIMLNSAGSQGLAHAQQTGAVTVTATEPASGLVGTATVTVTEPPLVNIVLLAGPSHQTRVAIGDSEKVQANGIYTSGGSPVINEQLTWETSDPDVMTVSNVAGEKGKLTALTLGHVTITATDPATGIFGTIAYTAVAPKVIHVEIVPGVAETAVGVPIRLSAIGHFSDGSASPIAVRWTADGGVTLSPAGDDVDAVANTVGTFQVLGKSPDPLLGPGSVMLTVVAKPAIQIAVGSMHSCALLPGIGVKCWGGNNAGALGQGDALSHGENDADGPMGRLLPIVPLGAHVYVKSISAGDAHTCALLGTGDVKCWGANSLGQLGYGDTNARGDSAGEMGDALAAVNLGAGRTATAVAAGGQHTCALLDNGAVKCWGYNGYGQLGLGDTADRGDQPGEMGDALAAVSLGTNRTARAISVGGLRSCAILDDNSAKCWGENLNGGIGVGFADPNNADQNALGDQPGELGDNLPALRFGGHSARSLSLSYLVACAVLDDGSAKCWGENGQGQLGLGDTTFRNDPNALPSIDLGVGRTAKEIASRETSTCVRLNDDTLKCFGQGTFVPLGYEDNVNRGDQPGEMGDALPTIGFGTTRTVKAVAGTSLHACAVLDNDAIKCWGLYGLGTSDGRARGADPGTMGDDLPAADLGQDPIVALGADHGCAIAPDGRVKCWGIGDSGQLGRGDSRRIGTVAADLGTSLPYVDLGTGRTALGLALAQDISCALLDNRQVKCWGSNYGGMLGIGVDFDTIPRVGDEPFEMGDALPYVDLGTGRTVKELASGFAGSHMCAILDDGSLKCWGQNSEGQLGLGHTTNIGTSSDQMGDALPAVDLGGHTVKSVTRGYSHTCAVLDNSQLKCWGTPDALGLGNLDPHGSGPGQMGANLPAVDLGASGVVTVAAGGSHTCAVLSTSLTKCWGFNGDGELGIESNVSRGTNNDMGNLLPFTPMGAGFIARQLGGGIQHTCALSTAGAVKCWGQSGAGQLGLGDTLTRGNTPGTMGDALPALDFGVGRTPKRMSVGRANSCVVLDDHSVACWGFNGQGQLAIGTTAVAIGDQPGEMGPALGRALLGF